MNNFEAILVNADVEFSMGMYQPPFPWFGGKSRVAHLVWPRFGNVPNFIDPFFGSGAMLFLRPHWPEVGIETVNDLDCYVANFFRALQHDPDGVAEYADWSVNEADLHARHDWLLRQSEFRERMHRDPDYYDAKIAGWWVWGICQWIGSGWCAEVNYATPEAAWQKRPHLGNPGRGVHRPSQKRPHLGDPGRANLYEYMQALAARLRRVRVCCGDWTRVLGETPTVKNGLTGVFLDPPYIDERDNDLYAIDSFTVAHDVAEWARQHGDDPLLRIALCGYEGNYAMPDTWEMLRWKAHGGYGSQGDGTGRENATREVIWFSPHCLKPSTIRQLSWLEGINA